MGGAERSEPPIPVENPASGPSQSDASFSREELVSLVAELRAALAVANERIAALEKLLEESRRAGKRQAAPFSKAGPKGNPARPGRKSGKDHGRHGHRMAPTSWDHERGATLPGACPRCGGEVVEDTEPAYQFQTEVPEPRPEVTRFRVHRGHCRGCGRALQGRHPEQSSDALGAAASQLGPRARALAVWYHYGLGLSFAKTAQAMGYLGVKVTRSGLCGASLSIAGALAPTHEAIKTTIAQAASVTMDESGWRIGGWHAWGWAAASEAVTLYEVAWGRGFDQAKSLVPEGYRDVIVRDGWSAYHRYESASHQSCLAHLLRRAHEMRIDNPKEEREVPLIVSLVLHKALDARGESARRRRQVVTECSEVIEVLASKEHPYDPNHRLVAHLAAEHERGALFTFLTHPGVEATNWLGKQAIRPAVVSRKVWGGNRTETGRSPRAAS